MKLIEIKEKVLERNEWVLPPFQREFVWSEEKRIIEFIESVFSEWPIGSIILWVPDPKDEDIIKKRRLQISAGGEPQYLQEYIIDGQQRITTLLRILNNEPFNFKGKEKKLYFDFSSRKFMFMEEDGLSKNLVLLGDVIRLKHSEIKQELNLDKLDYEVDDVIGELKKIGDYDITIQKPKKTISLKNAQELFIRLNTGGKQLPSVDLALAYISLLWDNSREEFKNFKEELKPTGFYFDLDFFVRCLSAISLEQSLTKKLIRSFKSDNIEGDWEITKGGIEKTIDFLKATLSLSSNIFLEAENTLVPIVLLFSKKESAVKNKMNLLTYWFVVSYINQRFSGQSTATLNYDIKTILESDAPIDGLIKNLEEDKSTFVTTSGDIKGNQFKFVLYCLLKSLKARDFVSGFGIDTITASKSNRLDFHHIFADDILKESKFKDDKEDIANKTFLTNKSNKEISASDPTYLSEYPKELLKAHLIPTDENLWKLQE
jgi:uncharacterized protein with ParB-like and HNH nuclease domain